MVWPSASDCRVGSLSSSVKVQPTELSVLASPGTSLTGSSEKVPIYVEWLVKPGSGALELDECGTKVAVCLSVRSASSKVTVPAALRLPGPAGLPGGWTTLV